MRKLISIAALLALMLFGTVVGARADCDYHGDDNKVAPDECVAIDACRKHSGKELGACFARATKNECDGWNLSESEEAACSAVASSRTASARVTVTPSYQGPPPLGWVYLPYTRCAEWAPWYPPTCSTGMVTVVADGLNVRQTPNGYPTLALVNGTPFTPLQRDGNWLLVAPACDLTPTWAWSWTANVPLMRCWVYFP
jgi:hypothetical protein